MISNVVTVVADEIHIFKILLLCELLFGIERCIDKTRYLIIGVLGAIVSEIMYCMGEGFIEYTVGTILYVIFLYLCINWIFNIKKYTVMVLTIELMFITSMLDTMSLVVVDIIVEVLGLQQLVFEKIFQSALSLVFVIVMLYLSKRKYQTKMQAVEIKKSLIFVLLISADAIIAATIPIISEKEIIKAKQEFFLVVAFLVLVGMFIQLGTVIMLNKSNAVYAERDELQKRYLNEQKKHYEYLEVREEETKKFRHDLRNHMLMLEHLRRGNQKEFDEYIERMNLTIDNFGNYISVNNGIADAIINKYYAEMCSKGIQLDVKGTLPKVCTIDAYDLCTIFSNVLSNAMEAVEKIDSKKIYLECRYTDDEIFIKEKNSYMNVGQFDKDKIITWKSDKNVHGYGLNNIKDVVSKNGGIVKIETKNDEFCISLMMKI
ncbi:MAG: GHKL domain-containing protein [Lachnospiraceae bacterium]|nr:GHKL domain-containing protein [Lachnospiraceae bacterium]